MRKLAGTVHLPVWVDGPDGAKTLDRTEVFLKGTELPEWAVPLVGDHVFEPGEAPERNAPEPRPEPEPSNPKPAEPKPARTPRKRAARTPQK